MKRENTNRRHAMPRRESGFSLIELAIVLTLIGVVSAFALPNVTRTLEAGRGKAAAKSVLDAFNYARAQAIRTGSNQVVFFDVDGPDVGGGPGLGDTLGNSLTTEDGTWVPIFVLDDGRPGSANQDCLIDASEGRVVFHAEDGVLYGANFPTAADTAPDDQAATIPATGSTFTAPNGAAVTWVLFRPDGIPVAMDAACNTGQLGSGSGTIYLQTANRDYAITLSPLGAARVHTWNRSTGAWTS